MMEYDSKVCVERGADFLDEKIPGWFAKIDLDKLKLDDCYACVLGQLVIPQYAHGHERPFYTMIRLFAMDSAKIHHLGFMLGELASHSAWDDLTDHWKAEIKKRRNREPEEEMA